MVLDPVFSSLKSSSLTAGPDLQFGSFNKVLFASLVMNVNFTNCIISLPYDQMLAS